MQRELLVERVQKWLRAMPTPVLAGWIVAIAYFTTSRLFNDHFPFTVLNMYSTVTTSSSSHLMAVDEQGEARYVDEYHSWKCDTAPEQANLQCNQAAPDLYTIPYVDRDNISYVRDHAGTGQEANRVKVAIVRRMWRLTGESGPPPWTQCELLQCTAVRK